MLVSLLQTGIKPAPEGKVENSVMDKLSKGWRYVMDGNVDDAIRNYKECVVLFNVLSYQHQQMVGVLVKIFRCKYNCSIM